MDLSDGVRVSVIGQGTWQLERADRAAAMRTLQEGVDAGMTHVDTAEMYGDGEVEKLVGEALGHRRDDLVLATKVLPQNATRKGTRAACEASLRRLGTDRIDLYLLHWYGAHPLGETVAAFEELRGQGKIRAWGVSNFDAGELNELLSIADEGHVACNQLFYHLGERGIEHAVLPFCQRQAIPVVAYSPFGSGDFPTRGRVRRVLDEIATAHRADAYQVALAFLIGTPGIAAIPRTTDPNHARSNAAAAAIVLSDDERNRIDAAFPRGPKRAGVPML